MSNALDPAGTDWPAIVHEHGDAVWRLARRLLDDEADASDCFQETFVAALAASRSAPVANWPGFLRRICTARAIDLLRRRIRDRRRTALTVLPRQQAEVFTLAVVEDLPHAEVAALCGLTASHVGVLVHRARARLRTSLVERADRGATAVLPARP